MRTDLYLIGNDFFRAAFLIGQTSTFFAEKDSESSSFFGGRMRERSLVGDYEGSSGY